MADLIKNKKAFHDYQIIETYESGIALTGTEVKSCRGHNISFADSYVKVSDGEAFLYNVHISPYEKGNINNHDPKRVRRLLMHRSEIRRIGAISQQQRLTLIPLSFYLKNGRIKVAIGLCRGKTHHDKRETMKRKEDEKHMRRVLKRRG